MNDLVSVVVPVYNVYKYLSECINSILAQTYTNIEIILVDDGSTDGCGTLCDEYDKQHTNIRVIHRENSGLGIARNTGIDNAAGKYIAFVDGDDHIGDRHIEKLITCIDEYDGDACYGGYRRQFEKDCLVIENPLKDRVYQGYDIISQFLPHMFGRLNYAVRNDIQMSVCMGLYSLELIRKHDIRFHSERELISEDLIFNIDFLEKASKICVTDSCEYYYRYNGGSITKSYRPDRLKKKSDFIKYIIDRTKSLGIFEVSEQRIYSNFMESVRGIIRSEQQAYKINGLKNSVSRIRDICNDPFVVEICGKYDKTNLTMRWRIIHSLVKRKKARLLWVASFVRNTEMHYAYFSQV